MSDNWLPFAKNEVVRINNKIPCDNEVVTMSDN